MGQREPISVVVHKEGARVVITHMDLAIYCHMLHRLKEANLPIVDVVRISESQHEFVFDDPAGVIRQIEVQFANGRDAAFADAQRSLKKLMRIHLQKRDGRARTYQRGAKHL